MSTQTRLTDKTRRLVYMAILIAIILVMAFTPLGYLKTAGIEITFFQGPVIVGGILMGPAAGAILGGVFGLTSFIQCFGLSAFGAALLEINAVYTFVLCFFARVLMGWLTGLIIRALQKVDRTKFASYAVTSLAAPVLNTVFFVGGLILLFGSTPYIQGMMAETGATNLLSFAVAFVALNGVIEAAACFLLGTAISKALASVPKR